MPPSPLIAVLAGRFARCVELFRDPDSKDEQKSQFRALLEMLQTTAIELRDEGGRISFTGAPVAPADIGTLGARLALHNVGEIKVPRGAPPPEVFELIRALAEQPGLEDVPSRLRAVGATHVSVTLANSETPPSAPQPKPSPPPPGLGTEGILRGDPMRDIASPRTRVEGVPILTYDPPPPDADQALPSRGTAVPDAMLPASAPTPTPPPAGDSSRWSAAATPPAPPAAAPPAVPPPPPAPKRPTGPRTVADDVIETLTRNPQSPDVGDMLATLGQEVETALRANKIERVLAISVNVVQLEQRANDESARRHYSIALRRMFTKPTLQRFTELLTVPAERANAILALRRSGAAAVEVLIDLLVKAPNVTERRAAFDALRQMSEGTEQLVGMLDHQQWFVKRNVAELVGELGMTEAIPGLGRLLSHDDERVRKAAALALAKIGTSGAVESLRRALRDKSSEVRVQVALGMGGRRSSGLAMPLVVALDEEKDERVQRELILALGRIATSDAVQALIKLSQPSRKLFSRRPTAVRVAAVEALRIAGTAAAKGTLEGLAGESDSEVRSAAKNALDELKKKRSN